MDQSVIDLLLLQIGDLPDLKRSQAREAIVLANGYLPGLEASSARDLLAWDLTLLFWLDDRSDLQTDGLPTSVQWVPLLWMLDHDLHATTPESAAFVRLRERLDAHTRARASLKLWSSTAAQTFRSWAREAQHSAGLRPLTYLQYLENGISSSAVPHILATLALLLPLKLNLTQRLQDHRAHPIVRNLALASRLENDLFSIDKERLEGCQANAVLLLEQEMEPAQACAVVQTHLAVCRKELKNQLAELPAGDPIAGLVHGMIDAHRDWYLGASQRYSQATPTHSQTAA